MSEYKMLRLLVSWLKCMTYPSTQQQLKHMQLKRKRQVDIFQIVCSCGSADYPTLLLHLIHVLNGEKISCIYHLVQHKFKTYILPSAE